MSNLNKLNNLLEQSVGQESPIAPESIRNAFMDRFNFLGVEGIEITDVSMDTSGSIYVDFSEDDEEMTVMFNADPEEGASAIVVDTDDDEEGEVTVIDLEPLAPSMLKTPFGEYLNLSDLSWMNLATLLAILQAGDMEISNQTRAYQSLDAHGNILVTPAPEGADEAFKVVVRAGKRMKLPMVRRKVKKRLTANQRAGLRKAKRTKKTYASKRKRALSLKLRKRLKMKPTKTPKGYRVG